MQAPPTAMATEALSRSLSPDGRIRDIPRLLRTIYSGIPPARLCGIQHYTPKECALSPPTLRPPLAPSAYPMPNRQRMTLCHRRRVCHASAATTTLAIVSSRPTPNSILLNGMDGIGTASTALTNDYATSLGTTLLNGFALPGGSHHCGAGLLRAPLGDVATLPLLPCFFHDRAGHRPGRTAPQCSGSGRGVEPGAPTAGDRTRAFSHRCDRR